MHPDKELTARINRAQYIYLRSIREPFDNQLELLIEEATANESERGSISRPNELPEIAALFKNTAPIESIPGCLTYRLSWKCYVAYLVTEECVGSCGSYDDESYEGRLLRRYAKSHFLDHLSRDTGAHSTPLLHYKITCLNHLIDFAAENPPEIEVVSNFAGKGIN